MARIFHSGAEIDAGVASVSGGTVQPDGANTSGQVTRDTTTFRSGAASWSATTGAGNNPCSISSTIQTFADGNTYFLRAYFRITSNPSAATSILGMGANNTANIFANLTTGGAVQLFVNSAAQGSASSAISDSTWHRVELKGVATATSTWTSAELLLDGVSVGTWSGSVSRGTTMAWGIALRTTDTPGANYSFNIDDVALNDSTGASNTSYPGSGKVVLLSPISDSAVGTGWTNDAAGTTNLWDAVNNTPPVGIADTSSSTGLHQIRNATSNANVNYDANMTSYTTAGIGASDTINAVLPWCASAAPVTTSSKQGTVGVASNPAIANVALAAAGTAGAFWSGTAAGTYGTGWKWSNGTVSNAPSVTLGTSPVMRVTQVTSSTRIAMVCGMFMYVDYTPAAAVTRTPRNPAINYADPAFF